MNKRKPTTRYKIKLNKGIKRHTERIKEYQRKIKRIIKYTGQNATLGRESQGKRKKDYFAKIVLKWSNTHKGRHIDGTKEITTKYNSISANMREKQMERQGQCVTE